MAFSSPQPKGLSLRLYENRSVLTVILACLTIVFSLAGWLAALEIKSLRDLISLVVLVTGSFVPSASLASEQHPNLAIAIGRFFGLAATISGAILIGAATMGQTLSAFWTRAFRRGHAVVIGETPLTERLVRILRAHGHHTLHIVAPPKSPPALVDARRISAVGLHDIVAQAGLARASTVIIDAGNDAATLSAARALWSWGSQHANSLQRLALRIADPLLADATAQEMLPSKPSDPPRPLLFDENQIMAQRQLKTLPLFRVASALKQDRVHALIVGFGDLGEKLLDQVMLTSIAGKLLEPVVTVIDRDAAKAEARFRARRPGVSSSLDIEFITMDVGCDPLEEDQSPQCLADVLKRGKAIPFTAVYVALPRDSDTLHAARLLQRLKRRHALLDVPLIYAHRTADAWPLSTVDVWSSSQPRQGMSAMSLTDDDLATSILAPQSRTHLAQRLHDTYRAGPGVSGAASVPWDQLPETYRRATLRAADHVPAKLWTLGLEPQQTPDHRLSLSTADAKKLGDLLSVGESDPRLADLSRVEHDRWCVERKLDGWRYGKTRDNNRLIHNLLVPWKTLKKKPEEVKKDADQVLAALRSVIGR